MLKKTRTKWAYKCGKSEHRAGRLLGLLIILNIFLERLNVGSLFKLIALIITFIIWLKYIVSHNLEKKLFGHYGPRG